MKSNVVIILMLVLTFTKTSHAQTKITAASFGADCPLAQIQTSNEITTLQQKLSTYYQEQITDLQLKAKQISSDCFKDIPKNFDSKLNLIKLIAEKLAPTPLPIGLTIGNTEIKCSGKQTFISTFETIFSNLKSEPKNINQIEGTHKGIMDKVYGKCSNEQDYKHCIFQELSPEGQIGSIWETQCKKQFDLTQDEEIRKAIKDTQIEVVKSDVAYQAINVVYNEFEKLLDSASDGSDNNVCSQKKTVIAQGLRGLISSGSSLFSTMGPPMAALGALLVTRPLNQLIENWASGQGDINELVNANEKIFEGKESPFNIYSCAWFAASKLRCQRDSEYNIEKCEPKDENKIFSDIINRVQTPRDTENSTPTDLDRDRYVADLELLSKDIMLASNKSYKKIFEDWETNLKSLENEKPKKTGTALAIFIDKIKPKLEALNTSIKNIVKHEFPESDENIQKLKNNLNDDDIVELNKFNNAFIDLKNAFNDEKLKQNSGTYCSLYSPIKDICYLQVGFKQFTSDKISTDVKRYAKIMNYSKDANEINKFFNSISENRLAEQSFHNEWKSIETIRAKIPDTSETQTNQNNNSRPARKSSQSFSLSNADVMTVLTKCLMSYHYSRGVSKGSNVLLYDKACDFLKNNRCKDIMRIDFNKMKIPILESTGENDHENICELNQKIPDILERATKELESTGKICGLNKESLLRFKKD